MKSRSLSALLAFASLALAAPALLNAQHAHLSALEAVPQDSKDQPQSAPSVDAILKLAAAGNPIAQNNLGFYYAFGKGVPQSYPQALKWLSAAASAGFAPAEVNLAVLYEKGWTGKVDVEQAMRWYRDAAEQGNPSAQCKLGNFYHYAHGVPRNDAVAAEWYRKAAEQGNAAAETTSARCTSTAQASRKTMQRPSIGIAKPRLRASPKPRATWA